jgi:hypothetical protein
MASHFALDVVDKSPTLLFHTNQAFCSDAGLVDFA